MNVSCSAPIGEPKSSVTLVQSPQCHRGYGGQPCFARKCCSLLSFCLSSPMRRVRKLIFASNMELVGESPLPLEQRSRRSIRAHRVRLLEKYMAAVWGLPPVRSVIASREVADQLWCSNIHTMPALVPAVTSSRRLAELTSRSPVATSPVNPATRTAGVMEYTSVYHRTNPAR